MADSITIKRATGQSRDGITGEIIPAGTPVAHLVLNSRCAPFLTAASLRQLADEIDAGEGLLFKSTGPSSESERWPALGWTGLVAKRQKN